MLGDERLSIGSGPRLRARLVPRAELGAERDAMFALLGESFLGVTRRAFETDLAGKDWAVLLEDARGELQGFTTLAFYRAAFAGQSLDVACSGDTIVRPRAWGSPALPRAWIAAIETLRARSTADRAVWLLLVSGFRTYRFLPLFWRRFHPRTSDAESQALSDHLARERWGQRFDAERGIVRFAEPQVLVPGLRGIPSERRADPEVAWFERSNPGHAQGDELVCLTELTRDNLTPLGWRMLPDAARAARAPHPGLTRDGRG